MSKERGGCEDGNDHNYVFTRAHKGFFNGARECCAFHDLIFFVLNRIDIGGLFRDQISRRCWRERISGGGCLTVLGAAGAGVLTGSENGYWIRSSMTGKGAAWTWSASCFSTRLN